MFKMFHARQILVCAPVDARSFQIKDSEDIFSTNEPYSIMSSGYSRRNWSMTMKERNRDDDDIGG